MCTATLLECFFISSVCRLRIMDAQSFDLGSLSDWTPTACVQTSTPINSKLQQNLSTDSIVTWTPDDSALTAPFACECNSTDDSDNHHDSPSSVVLWTPESSREISTGANHDSCNSFIVSWTPEGDKCTLRDCSSTSIVSWTPEAGKATPRKGSPCSSTSVVLWTPEAGIYRHIYPQYIPLS